MKKILGLKKSKLIATILVALFLNQVSFAGEFTFLNGAIYYLNDDGTPATGWRWLDTNNDGLCECYRFGLDGALVTNTVVKGKEVNSEGQWVVDGVVQRVFKNTGRPFVEFNQTLDFDDNNKYIYVGTMSTVSSTKRINATSKDVKALMEADLNMDFVGPDGKFERPKDGMVYGKGSKAAIEKRPVATKSSWGVIADALIEEETIYLSATESIVAGRDMRKFKTASNKYTEKADNVKIYGGDIWNDVMILQGNGAYVKFSATEKNSKSKYKANYFTAEVAHQTHGESTADTYCGVEVYLNGRSVEVFDEFCDGEPETIEMWLDDSDSNVELRAVVTGDAPGRKIYIRNARFRQVKDKDDD